MSLLDNEWELFYGVGVGDLACWQLAAGKGRARRMSNSECRMKSSTNTKPKPTDSLESFGILMESLRICEWCRAYGSGSVSRRVKGTSVENGTGESPVATAEPAWPWTYAQSEVSIVETEETMLHRGRMVSLFFEIIP